MRVERIIEYSALIIYITLAFGGGSILLVRFRSRASNLRIRARSPALAIFPGLYAIVVGGLLIPLQELLRMNGVEYPCRLSLAQSWFFIPLWGAPFALRSLRVIIATDKGRKDKYGFILRRRTTLYMQAFLCAVALCIVVGVSEVLQPYKRGLGVTRGGPRGGACLMMMECRFLLPLFFLQTIIFAVLGYTLRNLNDLLNISNELRLNFFLYLVFALPYFGLHLHFRYRTEREVPTYLQLLLSFMVVSAMVNTMWVSIGGVDEFRQWLGFKRSSESDETSTTVASDDSGGMPALRHRGAKAGSPSLMENVTQSDILRWKRHYKDVPTIMRNERMSVAFGAMANRFLCAEAYEFLVAVSDYRTSTGVGAGPGLQHMLYKDICKTFIAVNSEHEINIGEEQRQEVSGYLRYKDFSRLRRSERMSVFTCAEREVVSMLELNLLLTFHESTAFVETCAAVDVEEHVWELEGKVISGHEVGETRAATVEESRDGTASGSGYALSFLSSISDNTSGDDVSLEVDGSSSCSERDGGDANGRGVDGAIKSRLGEEDAGVDDIEAARSGASEESQVHKELNRVLASVGR